MRTYTKRGGGGPVRSSLPRFDLRTDPVQSRCDNGFLFGGIAPMCKRCGEGGSVERAKPKPSLLFLAVLVLMPSAWGQNATIHLSADLREAPGRIFHAR